MNHSPDNLLSNSLPPISSHRRTCNCPTLTGLANIWLKLDDCHQEMWRYDKSWINLTSELTVSELCNVWGERSAWGERCVRGEEWEVCEKWEECGRGEECECKRGGECERGEECVRGEVCERGVECGKGTVFTTVPLPLVWVKKSIKVLPIWSVAIVYRIWCYYSTCIPNIESGNARQPGKKLAVSADSFQFLWSSRWSRC